MLEKKADEAAKLATDSANQIITKIEAAEKRVEEHEAEKMAHPPVHMTREEKNFIVSMENAQRGMDKAMKTILSKYASATVAAKNAYVSALKKLGTTNATAPKKTAPIETTDAKHVAAAKKAAEGQCSAQSNLLACAAEASRLESACSCGSVDIDMVTIDPMSARCSNRSCRLPIHDKQRMAAELQAIDAVRALGVQRHELW